MQRRTFFRYAAASGVGIAAGAYLYKHKANADVVSRAIDRVPLLIPGDSGPLGVLNILETPLALKAHAATLPLIQGKPSPFLVYETQYGGKTYQNPIIRVKRGSRFTATLKNGLDEPTIIHWHGLHVPSVMDGHPRTTIAAGGRYDYAFTVTNRGGMYWYHTHSHNLTAKQAYFGLAGIFMVEDEEELALRRALHLVPGITELPLLIQDKQFNAAGALVYGGGMMQQMMGQLGDTIMVNLTPQPQLNITNRLYRFRILNGSNSRIYKLAFVQRGKTLPYTVIGTDAGLLEQPYAVQEVFLAPAERLDVLFDASKLGSGDEILLKSLTFEAMNNEMMGGGMMGGMGGMGSAGLALGAEFEIMRLVVSASANPVASLTVPRKLSSIQRITTKDAAVRTISLSMRQMQWLINGESFDMEKYPLKSRKNTVELWDIANAEMSMPHPMHMHGFSFQVVSRLNSPAQVRKLSQDSSGRLVSDLGWKDTVLVWPGETVRIAIDFTHPYQGDQIYVFHCHNLEHEDQGMMVNHLVTAA